MKCLQLNCNRSGAAHRALDELAKRSSADVLIVSEPNRAFVRGEEWRKDTAGDVAIRIISKRLIVGASGAGPGFVWVTIENTTLYSV